VYGVQSIVGKNITSEDASRGQVEGNGPISAPSSKAALRSGKVAGWKGVGNQFKVNAGRRFHNL